MLNKKCLRIRRPVCLASLIFLGIIFILTGGKPPSPKWDVDAANGKTITLKGRVTSKEIKNNNLLVYLDDVTDESGIISIYSAGIIAYVSDYENLDDYIRLGSIVSAKGVFAPFSIPMNEGEFDARSYYCIRGYDGKLDRARIIGISRDYSYVKEGLNRLRQRSSRILYKGMDEESAGVTNAMVLGDKTGIDSEIKELYQLAGISHVLALSGLHIAAVGLAILGLIKKLGVNTVTATIISGVIILGYAVMTGFSTSTIRAFIMFVLGAMAGCVKRTYDLLTGAAIASILILVDNPYYLYDSGFLLSFGAVLGIGIVLPVIDNLISLKVFDKRFVLKNGAKEIKGREYIESKIRGYKENIRKSLCASFSITLVTLPVMANTFYQISLYSVFLNLIIIPLMSVVLFTGFLGIGLGLIGECIGSLGNIACIFEIFSSLTLKITSVIIELYNRLSEGVSYLNGNLLIIGKVNWARVLIYYGIMIIGLVIAGRRVGLGSGYVLEVKGLYDKRIRLRRIKRWVEAVLVMFLSAIVACNCLLIRVRAPLEIRNVYVGQGDCAFIWGEDTVTIMIDGGSSDVKEVGKYKIIPVLKSNGIRTIDYCVITHMDSDHYSGILEIINNPQWGIRIKNLILSESYLNYLTSSEGSEELAPIVDAAYKQCIRIIPIKTGDILKMENVSLTCISPDQGQNYNGNDSSVVLELNCNSGEGRFNALFTGDISADVERSILDRISKVDYLKVAHHGSRNSSSDDFLKRAKPKLSVISAGINNSYGHPHEETLERLRNVNSNIYNTSIYGEIIVLNKDEGLIIRKFVN